MPNYTLKTVNSSTLPVYIKKDSTRGNLSNFSEKFCPGNSGLYNDFRVIRNGSGSWYA